MLCLSRYGLLVKRFPCCGSAHKTLDGLLQLRDTHTLSPDRIKRVISRLPETMSRNLKFPRPQNDMEARFSLHYNAARILLEGRLSLNHFEETAVSDPAVVELLPRIYQETIPDPERFGVSTPLWSGVEMEDDTIFQIEIEYLRGSMQNPLSREDLAAKLKDCLQYTGVNELAGSLAENIAAVDTCWNIRELMNDLNRLMPE